MGACHGAYCHHGHQPDRWERSHGGGHNRFHDMMKARQEMREHRDLDHDGHIGRYHGTDARGQKHHQNRGCDNNGGGGGFFDALERAGEKFLSFITFGLF